MKKILFVSTSTGLGGAEKTFSLIATGLDRKEFEPVAVVSLKPAGAYAERLRSAGIRVEAFDLGRIPTPVHLWRLSRLIAEIKPDIVHAFLYSAIQLSRLAKRRAPVPFKLVTSPRAIFRFRGPLLRGLDRMLKGADALLVSECEASRRYLLDHMGYAPERVVTIRNGVDADSLRPQPGERDKIRFDIGLSGGEFVVGAVGRMEPQKDPEALIEAVRALLLEFPQLRLLWVGDGPLREKLGERVMRERLSDRIFLVGERPQTREWLAAMDLFVLPSRFEGLPNVLLEAMAAGLPVIATRVDGTPEVIVDARDGLLVPPANPAALASALKRLITDPNLRGQLARSGTEKVNRNFTLQRMLKEYEAVYRKL